jgi:F0F1-type ATP synthase delta subunit
MISEKELKEEIKVTKAFIKYLIKNSKEEDFPEIQGYLDALEYCLNGKLD